MRVSIGQRIGAIILGAILAIIVAVSAGIYERQVIASVERRVTAATTIQLAAQNLDKRFIVLQQTAERLIGGNDAALAQSLPRDWAAIETGLAALRKVARDNEIWPLVKRLAQQALPLGPLNTRMIENRRAVGFDNTSGQRGAMLQAGHAFQNKLEEVRGKAIGMTFDIANQLTITMLQMRGFEVEYALSGDRVRFEAELAKASAEFLSILKTAPFFDTVKEEVRILLAAYMDAAQAYAAAYEALNASAAESGRIREAIIPLLAELVRNAETAEAMARTLAGETRDRIVMVSGGITLAMVLLIILASIVVARGILNPIHRMTSAMKALAEGNLDVVSPDASRGDEIGAMAQAYEVFRGHETERRQMAMAEQQRERANAAEQQAQRQREAAMAAEIADLSKAVSEGDLGRRLDLAGKEGDFREVSHSINRLTDTLAGVIGELSAVLQALANGEVGRNMRLSWRVRRPEAGGECVVVADGRIRRPARRLNPCGPRCLGRDHRWCRGPGAAHRTPGGLA
jgi:methyl-accepting chemotaxis protein